MLDVLAKAPAFALPSVDGTTVQLRDFAGKWLVLYFYPRDMTPGCTAQACAFRDAHAPLRRLGAEVVGISRDAAARHARFRDAQQLPFALLSDVDAKVAAQYGAWAEKTLYGRTSWGIVRSTFLIDPQGIVRAVWRKVKVAGHVDAVVQALQAARG